MRVNLSYTLPNVVQIFRNSHFYLVQLRFHRVLYSLRQVFYTKKFGNFRAQKTSCSCMHVQCAWSTLIDMWQVAFPMKRFFFLFHCLGISGVLTFIHIMWGTTLYVISDVVHYRTSWLPLRIEQSTQLRSFVCRAKRVMTLHSQRSQAFCWWLLAWHKSGISMTFSVAESSASDVSTQRSAFSAFFSGL